MAVVDYTERPTLSYQQLLDTDSHEVPEVLRWFSPMPPSEADIPVERYTSAEYHNEEFKRLWTRTWQFACRDEHVPEEGDYFVYDIGRYSILIVRGADDQPYIRHGR